MIIVKKALDRRTFLRGAGAALALPLLDAMAPAMSAAAATAVNPVRRLGYVYIPMGAHLAKWTPSVEGRLSESRSLIANPGLRNRSSVGSA